MTASNLLDRIRASGLLDAAQLDELARLPESRSADPRPLAVAVSDRGWLTKFQLNTIASGRGTNLIAGPYILLGRLGEGRLGHVYKARHRHTKRTVALKFIRKEKLTSPEAVRRFYQEAEAAATLHHPNIVLAYDAGPVGTFHYLATEFVEGPDLARLVEGSGKLSPAVACEYVRQAATGLGHAHEKGLVHGDVKPSKLLVSRDGSAEVVKVLGVGFTAPGAASVSGDVEGLGRSLRFLLTGQTSDDTRPLASLGVRVPSGLQAVLDRMTAKKPEDRYHSAAEVAEALRPFCPPPEVNGATKPESPRLPARSAGRRMVLLSLAGGVAVVLAGIAVVALFLLQGQPGGNQSQGPAPTLPAPEASRPVVPATAPIPEPVKPAAPVVKVGDGRLMLSRPGVNAAAYCLGGTALVVTSQTEGVAVIDRRTGEELRRFGSPTVAGESRGCLAVSADGRRALVAHADRVPRLWNLETGQVVHELVDHQEPARAVALSPDGRLGLTAGGGVYGKDVEVRVWNLTDGKLLRRLGGHQKDVWQVALSPDGTRAASVSYDHVPWMWDVESGKAVMKIEHLKPHIPRSVRFSPDGKSVVFACLYATAIQCDSETGKEQRRYPGPRSWVWEAAFTPDGRHVVTTSGYDNPRGGEVVVDDGTVRVHDVMAGGVRATLSGHKCVPQQLSVSPDGRRAVTVDHGGMVIEWDLETAYTVP